MEMFSVDQEINASLATPLDPIDDLLAGEFLIHPRLSKKTDEKFSDLVVLCLCWCVSCAVR